MLNERIQEHDDQHNLRRGALRGKVSNVIIWASGLLGIASLSMLSNGGQIGPCPCCGSPACPNAAAAQGILGGLIAFGAQIWSRLWSRKKK